MLFVSGIDDGRATNFGLLLRFPIKRPLTHFGILSSDIYKHADLELTKKRCSKLKESDTERATGIWPCVEHLSSQNRSAEVYSTQLTTIFTIAINHEFFSNRRAERRPLMKRMRSLKRMTRRSNNSRFFIKLSSDWFVYEYLLLCRFSSSLIIGFKNFFTVIGVLRLYEIVGIEGNLLKSPTNEVRTFAALMWTCISKLCSSCRLILNRCSPSKKRWPCREWTENEFALYVPC